MHAGSRFFTYALLLFAGGVAAARADNFEVDPVVVSLAPGVQSGDVMIRNTSTHAMRFSIRTYTWSQTRTEEQKLQETDDLLAFPEVFDIPAQGAQRIRVGLTVLARTGETSYRLIVNEVPPPNFNAPHGAQLQIVTHVSIPVFSAASVALRAQAALSTLRQDGRNVAYDVTNSGDQHIRPSQARVTLKDAGGHELWTRLQNVWYVLAGTTRSVIIAPPAQACRAATSVNVHWLDGASRDAAWNGALCSR